MTIQFRPKDSPDSRMYAPHRDLAYLFQSLAVHAANQFDESNLPNGIWPWGSVGPFTDADLEKAAEAYYGMLPMAWTDPMTPPEELISKSGLDAADPKAVTAILAAIGLTTTYAFIKGIREATRTPADAAFLSQEIPQGLQKIRRAVARPRLIRWVRAARRWLSDTWKILTSRETTCTTPKE